MKDVETYKLTLTHTIKKEEDGLIYTAKAERDIVSEINLSVGDGTPKEFVVEHLFNQFRKYLYDGET